MTGRGGLRSQNILVHPAAVEMEERHRRVVAQGAGGEAAIEFGEHVFRHGVGVRKRLRADLDPHQFDKLGVGMDHTLDAMGDRGGIRGEEAGVEALDAAGRGDGARDQEQARGVGQQARISEWLPRAFEPGRALGLAPEAEAGLLAGFADRGDRERLGT